MDKMEFAKVMYGLSENFGAKTTKDQISFLYEMFIADGINMGQIKQAARQIIRTKKDSYGRMPTYAEFIEAIEGNKEQLSEIEAQTVIKLIRSEGAYGEPTLSEKTKAVINNRFGGWKSLCGSLEESKLNWFIKEFKEAYSSEVSKQPLLTDAEARGILDRAHRMIEG